MGKQALIDQAAGSLTAALNARAAKAISGALDATERTANPADAQDVTLSSGGRTVRTSLAGLERAAADAMNDAAPFLIPADETFGEQTFLPAANLDALAAELIKAVPGLWALRNVAYTCRWQRTGPKQGGEPVYATVKVLSALNRHLCGYDVVVTVSADHCRDAEYSRFQMRAELDHQLSAVTVDENGKLSIGRPDLVMFFGEYERYGAWRNDIRIAEGVFKQKRLSLDA